MPIPRTKPKKQRETTQPTDPLTPDPPEERDPAPSSWQDIRHFAPREFTCKCEGLCDHPTVISLDVVAKIDQIREQLGIPLTIASGTRCERYNRKVNGSPRSAHVPKNGISHAVDISCQDAGLRHRLLEAAMPLFSRIGIAKDFIHLDDDPELPQKIIWVY